MTSFILIWYVLVAIGIYGLLDVRSKLSVKIRVKIFCLLWPISLPVVMLWAMVLGIMQRLGL